MALRPPSTPRAGSSTSSLPPAGSTPSSLPQSRRKSFLPASTSSASSTTPQAELDSLKEAVRRHDPSRYGTPIGGDLEDTGGTESPTPAETAVEKRKELRKRPSMVGMRSSLSRPVTPSTSSMPPPPLPSPKKVPAAELQVGDKVTFEAQGFPMEGSLRFLGGVDGKDGVWAGVVLDDQWTGMGKNDGSVKGKSYFTCPPQCGLFIPILKVTRKPTAKRPAPILTAGSRASKYAHLTASDLATNPPSPMAKPRTASSPTKPSAVPFPRSTPSTPSAQRVTSPTMTPKPRLPRPSFGASTPRAAGRPSMGIPTPSAARKSLGGSTSTITPARRPPSSLRSYRDIPPPLPSNNPSTPTAFAARRGSLASSTASHTESGRQTPSYSASGRVTPSFLGRSSRASLAVSVSDREDGMIGGRRSVLGRSQTPVSARSYSRQSDYSSVSAHSAASVRPGTGLGASSEEVKELREREAEVRALLEASERVGREVEERLSAKERELRDAQSLVVEFEAREKNREEADAREALVSAERAKGGEAVEGRVVELELQLAELVRKAEKEKREMEHKSAAKEGEIESLRERWEAEKEERKDVEKEVDRLRTAGQALVATYEEKIAEIEMSRLDVVERLEAVYDQREKDERRLSSTSSSQPPMSTQSSTFDRPGLSDSFGSSSHTSAADVINAENALAEAEHLRDKVGTLEELLEEARGQVEIEVEDAKKRRKAVEEKDAGWRKEVKTLKENIERSTQTESRLTLRIAELEAALSESHLALENERSEVEGLRHDASSAPSVSEDLKSAQKELKRAEQTAEGLREDLRGAEREIERLHAAAADKKEIPSPGRGDNSGSPRSRLGPQDDAGVAKEQIVGLKVIIETLTSENTELVEKTKVLMQESEELRDAQRALEATVENMMAEMGTAPTPAATERRASTTLVSNVPLQREVDDLRLRMQEVEKKAERDIKALNQEVTELESLVESKIYREDELEAEVEKYKRLASSSHSTSVPNGTTSSTNNNGRVASVASNYSGKASVHDEEGAVCEMCGEAGHDLDDCPIFGGGSLDKTSSSSAASVKSGDSGRPWCDDCEEYGHSLEDCPLANEIF